jgi:hypothetical protein
MHFCVLTQEESYRHYKKLYENVKKSYTSFNGMDFFNLKLFKGDFLLLKNRFHCQVFALFKEKNPRILITHYKAIDKALGVEHSLGAVLVSSDISNEEILFFINNVQVILKEVTTKILYPLNAHLNLGFSLPALQTNPEAITFLTSAGNQSVHKLLNAFQGGKIERRFYGMSYNVNHDPVYLEKIKNSIAELPAGYTVERISLFNYKKDIRDYNFIINESFKDHYAFFPLSFEEEWDLMKTALLVINRDYFRFLSHQGKRVALSLFFPDYNTCLKNGEDVRNLIRIFCHKANLERVRGVNVAIIPEYRGKGLIKYVRNENLLKVIEDGVTTIESSYIDEGNINSQENVKSTGAMPSHTFELYSLN